MKAFFLIIFGTFLLLKFGTVNLLITIQNESFGGVTLDRYDYGARFYDPQIGRWHSIDPLAEQYESSTPYGYVSENPINKFDPNGMYESTHTDEEGNIVAVYNDGDNGVYKHNGNKEATKKELDANHSAKNTSGNGEKMGETYTWDEFVAYYDKADGSHKNGELMINADGSFKPVDSKIIFNTSWDGAISERHNSSLDMTPAKIAIESAPNGIFDIKTNKTLAPHGSGTGRLLNRKYVTARSAGNYLAGLNASSSGESFRYSMILAGALHQGGVTGVLIIATELIPVPYGKAPWYGENSQCGRMFTRGWISNPQANDIKSAVNVFNQFVK